MECILLSNSVDPQLGFLGHFKQRIPELFPENANILFIPFALRDWKFYEEKAAIPFSEHGVRLNSIHKYSNYKKAILESSAIFVGGGNTFRLLNTLYYYKLINPIKTAIKNGAIFLGSSAGTNIAGPNIKTTNDMPIIEPPTFKALNLVPFNINPHYTIKTIKNHQGESRDIRLLEFLEENQNLVVAMYESTWIEYRNHSFILSGGKKCKIFSPNNKPKILSSSRALNLEIKKFYT